MARRAWRVRRGVLRLSILGEGGVLGGVYVWGWRS